MIDVAVIVGAAVLCCSVLLAFNCVCHIFRRRGFSSFEDDVEATGGVSMYGANVSAVADDSKVTFEPLPDILAKTVSSRALRPRITNLDKDKQAAAAKLVTVYKAFPRSQLLYIKEIGLGWFGQVLQGEAERIVSGNRKTKVVVKILKDDASPAEQRLFLEEVTPYRELDHTNILQLLGQCTETTPFLTIMEFPPLGDLKSYLIANKKGPLIQFMMDATQGLACMHSHGYVHHDFAARNCLLMSDYKLKLGDYGIAEDVYREDYYDTGQDLLPIRWMSPESLTSVSNVWQLTNFTVQSNVWSLGVMMWETLSLGGRPYSSLSDEDVLQKVVSHPSVHLPTPESSLPLLDRWYEVMEMCWQGAEDRPSTEDVLSFLKQIQAESSNHNDKDFENKWSETVSAEPRVVPVDETSSRSPSHRFESDFVASKPQNQSTRHVTEAMVHRTEEEASVNRFEDNFVSNTDTSRVPVEINVNNLTDLNDSILAYGGNSSETEDSLGSEKYKHILAPDSNLNPFSPVPMGMSTPTKTMDYSSKSQTEKSDAFQTALSIQDTQSTHFLTAADTNQHSSAFHSLSEQSSNDQKYSSRDENQNSRDEGYRTDPSRTPDIVISQDGTGLSESVNGVTSPSRKSNKKSRHLAVAEESDQRHSEYEDAKEIYMTKGATIPPSSMHSSRSLGTIPEDGIPVDSPSSSAITFEDPLSEDIGMSFEWDDYIGEELVGRVRYMSDESPSQVEEFNEWTFDQDSSSQSSETSHSKPSSIASDLSAPSDVEVTGRSKGLDTRAYVASLLTNRLGSLANPTNTPSHSQQSMFYSFSQNLDLDSSEHASTDPDSGSVLSMPSGGDDREEEGDLVAEVEEDKQGQEDLQISERNQLIKLQATEQPVAMETASDSPRVAVCGPHEQMLPASEISGEAVV